MIHGSRAAGYWFNPRGGESTLIGEYPCSATREFSPHSQGVDNDWVLVLDD
jgi:Putative collagen-binding domain of a collagenase